MASTNATPPMTGVGLLCDLRPPSGLSTNPTHGAIFRAAKLKTKLIPSVAAMGPISTAAGIQCMTVRFPTQFPRGGPAVLQEAGTAGNRNRDLCDVDEVFREWRSR